VPIFLFALLAVALAGIGARDQILLAQLGVAQGRRPAQLVTAMLSGTLAACAAGWAAQAAAPEFAPALRPMMAAIALALAGGESLLLRPPRPPREPTHSLGASAIVLFAHQLTDAARILVFALALTDPATAWLAVAGGAVGGGAALAIGWLSGGWLLSAGRGLRRLRVLGGGVLLLAACAVMLIARVGIDRIFRSIFS
jgi:hypothetical protein